MIHIVDYGVGNIQAFLTMYKRLGVEVCCASDAGLLSSAEKIILPGVGAFDHAMNLLKVSGMQEMLNKKILEDAVPVLGICVGMQMLAKSSEEGNLPGLGWIEGKVKSFHSNKSSVNLPMPHMGWNDVKPISNTTLFKGFSEDIRFYFLHSYYFDCDNQEHVGATAEYGFQFHCSIEKENIFGVQFHPEKSHHWGAMLLKNFAEL